MEKTKTEYVPGVCNIGKAEINARLRIGWFGLAITVVAWAVLLVAQAPAWTGLLLFIPAASGATGFLQGLLHFCAGFGMRGVFNFGAKVGQTITVEQAEFLRADRIKALKISLYSALIGAGLTAAGIVTLLVF